MSSYSELFNIPLSYAKEGIRDAQFPIEGYDELTVEEVTERLGRTLGRRSYGRYAITRSATRTERRS